MKRAVFLDRDGVINEDVHHLRDPQDLRLIPGSAQAIRRLNSCSIPVVVVTNQSVVARGYISEEQVVGIHQTLSALLAGSGAHIDRFYYCPHHPTEGLPPYRRECDCRKPKPGMLLQAAQELDCALAHSYLIGDTATDLIAGRRAGCHVVLVQTGYGLKTLREWREPFQPDYNALNLEQAVQWILEQLLESQ